MLFALIDSLSDCWRERCWWAVVCGSVSAVASAGRRWDALRKVTRLRDRDRVAYVLSGGIIGGVVSLVLSAIALRFSGDYVVAEVVVGGIILIALAFDWGSDAGLQLLRFGIAWGLKKWLGVDLSEIQKQATKRTSKRGASPKNSDTPDEPSQSG